MTINVLIWQEHRHEKIIGLVLSLCPKGTEGALENAFAGHGHVKDAVVERVAKRRA